MEARLMLYLAEKFAEKFISADRSAMIDSAINAEKEKYDAKIASQTAKIEKLEKKIAELEGESGN